MLSPIERAVEIFVYMLNDDENFGYSQIHRWGTNRKKTITLSDGSKVTLRLGDRDCSSAILEALKLAGIHTGTAMSTHTMKQELTKSRNFKWHSGTSYSAKRGDIYLSIQHHVAMCVHPYGSEYGDILGQFSQSEHGTIDGQTGDQTGHEASLGPYYNFPWDGILEWTGNGDVSDNTERVGDMDVDIRYALRVKDGKWLPQVKNFNNTDDDGFAGDPFHEHDGIYMRVNEGHIRYQIYADGVWSKWVYDGEKLYANHRIEGIRAYYITPDGKAFQQIYYRVQTTETEDYLPVCCDDGNSVPGFDGWAGEYGQAIDRLQCYIGSEPPEGFR